MLHACVQRFDVTGNLEKFCKILGTKQALSVKVLGCHIGCYIWCHMGCSDTNKKINYRIRQ